jgi:HAD superfamily hydrolase (TIGR01490 family)
VTRLAIFDFDGTILRGNSWHEFFRFELRRTPMRAPSLLGAYALRRLRIWPGERLRDFVLRGLRGLSAAEVAAIGERLHATRLAPQVRAAALAEIERRRSAGFVIAIATGTFDFAVAPLARIVRADLVVATTVAFADGHCLGCAAGEETLRSIKADAIRTVASTRGDIDWAASCAYSDSAMDIPLLALVGEPVFVTSNSALPAGVPAHTRLVNWPDVSA